MASLGRVLKAFFGGVFTLGGLALTSYMAWWLLTPRDGGGAAGWGAVALAGLARGIAFMGLVVGLALLVVGALLLRSAFRGRK